MSDPFRVPYGQLTKDEQDFWRLVVREIGFRLKPIDAPALLALCRLRTRWINLLAEEAAAGDDVYKVRVMSNMAFKQYWQAMESLGMTPAARSRMAAPEEAEEEDAILQFLKTS